MILDHFFLIINIPLFYDTITKLITWLKSEAVTPQNIK